MSKTKGVIGITNAKNHHKYQKVTLMFDERARNIIAAHFKDDTPYFKMLAVGTYATSLSYVPPGIERKRVGTNPLRSVKPSNNTSYIEGNTYTIGFTVNHTHMPDGISSRTRFPTNVAIGFNGQLVIEHPEDPKPAKDMVTNKRARSNLFTDRSYDLIKSTVIPPADEFKPITVLIMIDDTLYEVSAKKGTAIRALLAGSEVV